MIKRSTMMCLAYWEKRKKKKKVCVCVLCVCVCVCVCVSQRRGGGGGGGPEQRQRQRQRLWQRELQRKTTPLSSVFDVVFSPMKNSLAPRQKCAKQNVKGESANLLYPTIQNCISL